MRWQVPSCRPVPNIDYAKEDLGPSCHLAPRLCLPRCSFTAAHSSCHIHARCLKKALNTLLLSLDVSFLLKRKHLSSWFFAGSHPVKELYTHISRENKSHAKSNQVQL